MEKETSDFISNYVKALKESNAVVFAGAGLSINSGFFDWKKLLEPIAKRLGLDIKEEYDLTALAQYFVDKESWVNKMQEKTKNRLCKLMFSKNSKEFVMLNSVMISMYQVRHAITHKGNRLPIDKIKFEIYKLSLLNS